MTTERRPKDHVPTFHTVEEEARFWQSHSPLDFPEEWEEVGEQASPQSLSHILGVRLDAATLEQLSKLGRSKGIGPSTLARMWILERLAELEPHRDLH